MMKSSKSQNGNVAETVSEPGEPTESFIQSGHRMLLEQSHKMLAWREEVLQNEDIEAVHKMRVASRRLRAILDAYESVCDPKQFKKVYRRITRLADILGKARDTDVMIQNLQNQLEQTDSQAGIQWLVERLQDTRKQCQEELEASLLALNANSLQQQIEKCLSRAERC